MKTVKVGSKMRPSFYGFLGCTCSEETIGSLLIYLNLNSTDPEMAKVYDRALTRLRDLADMGRKVN